MNFEQLPPEEGAAGAGTMPEEVQPSATTPEAPVQPVEAGPAPSAVTENDRVMAAVAYATQVIIPIVVPAVMLLSEENKRRPFQKYHAIQSLGFFVATVIYEVLATIVFIGLTAVSLGCLACVLWLLFLLPVVPAFYYAYQAYQGLYFEIPVVTEFMIQNKWLEKPAA